MNPTNRRPWPRFRIEARHPADRLYTYRRDDVASAAEAERIARTANRRGYEVTVTHESLGPECRVTSRQVLFLAGLPIREPWAGARDGAR